MSGINKIFLGLLGFNVIISQVNAMDDDQSYISAAAAKSENHADGPYIINDTLLESSSMSERSDHRSFQSLLQSKPRMRIGIDIDGTIADTQSNTIDAYNRLSGTNIKVADVALYSTGKLLVLLADKLSNGDYSDNIRSPEVNKFFKEIRGNAKPFPYAAEYLTKLATQHDIYYISARIDTDENIKATEAWLTKYGFPLKYNRLCLGERDKGSIAKQLQIDLMVDDDPEYLNTLYRAGIPLVVFDASYNKDYDKPHCRISSWEECYAQLQLKH